MIKVSKILATGAVVAALGVAILPAATYATTYDPTTNTITAELVNDSGSGADGTYGFWGTSGADLINDASDIASNGLTIAGSLTDIEQTLEYLYTYMENNEPGAAALKTTLAGVGEITLDIAGDAELTPNHLGYVQFLERYVNGSTDPTTPVSAKIAVNVSGNVTFGDGTGPDFGGVTIADVANNGGAGTTVGPISLNATGAITIPNGSGSNIAGFLGAAVIKAGNTVISDGVTYITPSDDVFQAVVPATPATPAPIASPDTGLASTNSAALIAAACALAAIGSGAVVLRKLQK